MYNICTCIVSRYMFFDRVINTRLNLILLYKKARSQADMMNLRASAKPFEIRGVLAKKNAELKMYKTIPFDIDDDGDDGNFVDTLSEILGSSSKVTTSLDLDLAFGTVDATVNRACTSLLSPLSHFSPPISSPPSSAAAGEPI